MQAKIYRSVGFKEESYWSSPLMYVEVVTKGTEFDIYIYDIGFEPPYYDISCPYTDHPVYATQMNGTIKDADMFLRDKGIYSSGWREVSCQYALESNSLIRTDIRMDVREIFYKDESLHTIDKKYLIPFLNEVKKLSGYSAELFLHFQTTRGTLLTLNNIYYLMYRDDIKYDHPGFVAKGSLDNVAVLIEFSSILECKLHDQIRSKLLSYGEVISIELKFINADSHLILSQKSFEHKRVKKTELIQF